MDWIAIYGAVLSTALSIVAFWRWWFRDIHLSVQGFHQFENWRGAEIFGFTVQNSGRRATAVRKVKIEFCDRKSSNAKRLGEAVLDHSSTWNPATRTVPIEGESNAAKQEPNVLPPSGELHGCARPVSEYEPETHWIRIIAFARGSRREFHDWIAPQEKKGID